MPIQLINGPSIPAGQSLSNAIDCTTGAMVKITMPVGWTNALLTFQTSTDNVFFNDIFDVSGHEVSVVVRAGAAIIGVKPVRGWVKFRSGTTEKPIIQPQQRDFAVSIDTQA